MQVIKNIFLVQKPLRLIAHFLTPSQNAVARKAVF